MPKTPIDVSLHDLLHQREWLARLATALVSDPHHADDAAQQTWLLALVTRAPLREPRAWLATVLGNIVRQRHRGELRRTRREHDAAMQRAAIDTTAAAANERFETQRIVAAAVQALAEPFRTTVLLHHFEGMSLAAIARSQDAPAGTVRWRLFRAHELLREALAERCGTDWRRGVLALCAPVRRSALLGAALPLLLAAGIAASAIVWAASGAANDPPPARSDAAAAGGAPRDDHPIDRAPARGATDATTADAAAPSQASFVADQSAMVRARIAGSDGAPLPDATLRLVAAELDGEQAPTELLTRFVPAATAGPDGRVALALRAPADLLALISERPKDGFVAKATFAASADGHAEERIELHIGNGDDRDLGTIELSSVSTLDGRVLGADGQPLGDARVCVLRPPFPQFCDALAAVQHAPSATPATSTVDGAGAFELAGVRTGHTIVWASKPGFVSAWRLLDVTQRRTHCDDLVLRPGAAPVPAPIDAQVRVIVVDEHDDPVPQAQVCYRQQHANGGTSGGSVRVGPRGRASLPTIRLGDDDGAPVGLELAVISESPALANVVVAKPVAIANEIRIVLPATTPFEVHVNGDDGAPIDSFAIHWQADAPAFGSCYAQGSRGIATLAPPPTAATFEVSAAGRESRRVQFVPGETVSPLAVTLAPQRGVTVLVTAGGKPLANAIVSLVRGDEPILRNGLRSAGEQVGKWGATGRDGRFRIDYSRAEVLRIRVTAAGHASVLGEPHAYDPASGWDDVAIELSSGGTIEGIVRDHAGNVAPRALVAINDFHGDARTVFADAAGRFRCDHLRAVGHEVRITDRDLDGSWSSTGGFGSASEHSAVQPDCTVKEGEVTRFDLITDRCRLTGSLLPTGFDPRGWRARLMRAHDGMPTCKDVELRRDGSFALSSSSIGPHDLQLTAPGGPLGNVSVFSSLDLVAGDNRIDVPLALAPFRARAAGAAGGVAQLKQERALQRVFAYVKIDPATLDFSATLAPVGEVVLVEGTAGGGLRDVGRFVVAPR